MFLFSPSVDSDVGTRALEKCFSLWSYCPNIFQIFELVCMMHSIVRATGVDSQWATCPDHLSSPVQMEWSGALSTDPTWHEKFSI